MSSIVVVKGSDTRYAYTTLSSFQYSDGIDPRLCCDKTRLIRPNSLET